ATVSYMRPTDGLDTLDHDQPHCGPQQRGQTTTAEAQLPEFMLDDRDPMDPGRREQPDPAFWNDVDQNGLFRGERGRHRRTMAGSPGRPAGRRLLAPGRMRLATATAIPATVGIGAVVSLAGLTSSGGSPTAAANGGAAGPVSLGAPIPVSASAPATP